MPKTIILCVRNNGRPVKRARVALEFAFSDHPLSSGVTDSYYTDEKGRAVVSHSNTGRAYVHIDGHRQSSSINVPGTFSYTI